MTPTHDEHEAVDGTLGRDLLLADDHVRGCRGALFPDPHAYNTHTYVKETVCATRCAHSTAHSMRRRRRNERIARLPRWWCRWPTATGVKAKTEAAAAARPRQRRQRRQRRRRRRWRRSAGTRGAPRSVYVGQVRAGASAMRAAGHSCAPLVMKCAPARRARPSAASG